MKNTLRWVVFTAALAATQMPVALAAGGAAETPEEANQIQVLRQEIEHMRSEYENRIAGLERRLDQAEQGAEQSAEQETQQSPEQSPEQSLAQAPAQSAQAQPVQATAVPDYAPYVAEEPQVVPASGGASGARDNSFNPSIGVTLQGQAWSYGNDPDGYYIPGFPLGGEAGLAPEGLSLAETEISMSANVDDKFTAMVTFPIVVEDGDTSIELEEAWVETVALPAGLALRVGRYFADIGYLNTKHSHAWDFADQPLVYQAFLGGQYIDDGLQLRWLAPTDFYLEFGGEILRGDRYPAGGAGNSGIGSSTLNIKTGGDVGISNSWQIGLSWLQAKSDERASGYEYQPVLFTGDTDIYIADMVWKWAQNGNSRERNFKFQAEYMWRNEDGYYTLLPDFEAPYDEDWDEGAQGWYAQAIFQPFPRWRVGVRYDSLSGGTADPDFVGTPLYYLGADPKRYSMMVDWSNSEFSRLRFQYEHDMSGEMDDDQFALQYIFSIGAHGAHNF
ncbi:MAG: hypothetical protein EXR85_02610 [Xanthomonadales bacterium]|nr:hypothetical protein [Xanthomonadales bacterium]